MQYIYIYIYIKCTAFSRIKCDSFDVFTIGAKRMLVKSMKYNTYVIAAFQLFQVNYYYIDDIYYSC